MIQGRVYSGYHVTLDMNPRRSAERTLHRHLYRCTQSAEYRNGIWLKLSKGIWLVVIPQYLRIYLAASPLVMEESEHTYCLVSGTEQLRYDSIVAW